MGPNDLYRIDDDFAEDDEGNEYEIDGDEVYDAMTGEHVGWTDGDVLMNDDGTCGDIM